jgi:hypothetical protein
MVLQFLAQASRLVAFLCALSDLRGEQKKIRKTYPNLKIHRKAHSESIWHFVLAILAQFWYFELNLKLIRFAHNWNVGTVVQIPRH